MFLADRLADQVEGGALKPGGRQSQLAQNPGVSRSVVRESVQRLKSRAPLVSRPGWGVFINVPALHQPLLFDAAALESVSAVGPCMGPSPLARGCRL